MSPSMNQVVPVQVFGIGQPMNFAASVSMSSNHAITQMVKMHASDLAAEIIFGRWLYWNAVARDLPCAIER
jgi:hypothetical protein